MNELIEDSGRSPTILPVALRAATREEYGYFFHLYRDSLSGYFRQTLGWEDDFRRAAFRVSYPVARCQAIVVDGVSRAAGVLSTQVCEDGGVEVALLLVDPAFQSRQIGATLLHRVCDAAHRDGRAVKLQTFKLNERAARFYLRQGFQIVAEDEYYLHFRCVPCDAGPTVPALLSACVDTQLDAGRDRAAARLDVDAATSSTRSGPPNACTTAALIDWPMERSLQGTL
ncbi:GNAT family N-acetyltransferase [Mycetohabitans endofungorum]|uniref:GNAT family N-acetyltransferase n=1 Tax=Mycetohabitans endofungorum TaxID=417203 RepID=UPI002B058B8D|nr:GNAT family N-acetyltransferase [Mycetohabitans endofungorum]